MQKITRIVLIGLVVVAGLVWFGNHIMLRTSALPRIIMGAGWAVAFPLTVLTDKRFSAQHRVGWILVSELSAVGYFAPELQLPGYVRHLTSLIFVFWLIYYMRSIKEQAEQSTEGDAVNTAP